MSTCACRTTVLDLFIRDLTSLQLHCAATTRHQSATQSKALRFASHLATGSTRRHLQTQTHYPRASPVYPPPYASRDARSLSPHRSPPKESAIKSASAIKKSYRTEDEEAARTEKRLAKKITRVKENKFPRNRHRIRAFEQMYNITSATKKRLEHRYHLEKLKARSAAEGSAGDSVDEAPDVKTRHHAPAHISSAASKNATNNATREKSKNRSDLQKPRVLEAPKQMRLRSTPAARRPQSEHQPEALATPLIASIADADSNTSLAESPSLIGEHTLANDEEVEEEEEESVVLQLLDDLKHGRIPDHSDSSAAEFGATTESSSDLSTDVNNDSKPIRKQSKPKSIATPLKATDSANASAGKTGAAESEPAKFIDRRPSWAIKKETLREKYGQAGWQPRKKLSPDSLNGIRALYESNREVYSIPVLSAHLKVSPEAIHRILKSKWRPDEKEIEERRDRWKKRGVRKRAEITEHKQRTRMVQSVRSHDLRQDFAKTFGEDDPRTKRRFAR